MQRISLLSRHEGAHVVRETDPRARLNPMNQAIGPAVRDRHVPHHLQCQPVGLLRRWCLVEEEAGGGVHIWLIDGDPVRDQIG